MYNRYIPQPDGTYRRNRIQDVPNAQEQQPPEPPIDHKEPEPPPCSSCVHACPPRRPVPQWENRRKDNTGVSTFLRQLLPKDFGVEDLLVVLLLLLMAGDSQEKQNTALLTLALYLFL